MPEREQDVEEAGSKKEAASVGARPPFLRLVGITKSFGGTRALQDVSLDFELGQVHAICGENGAGKSTLIKTIMGVLQPDAGRIELAGRPVVIPDAKTARSLGFSAVYQEPLLYPHLSVLDNLFVARPMLTRSGGLDTSAMLARARAVFEQLDLEPDLLQERMGNLRLGYQQLVLIAQALIDEARLVIFDEPTSILSATETERLFQIISRLRQDGRAIVYISHRFEELEEVADRVSVLTDGRVVGELPTHPLDVDQVVRLMSGTDLRSFEEGPSRARVLPSGPAVLEVRDLSRPPLYNQVSWSVHAGEVVGFYGQVGAGRSEMAQGIFGVLPSTSGTVLLDGRPVRFRSPRQAIDHGIGYLPEDRKTQGIFGTQAISDNTVSVVLGKLSAWLTRYVFRRKVLDVTEEQRRALQIKMPGPSAPILSLSGGGQQKVVLGRWMAERLRVMVLDEPTRGIDVMTKREFHRIIRELASSGLAVVVISSDLPEVLAVSDRVLVMRRGRLVAEYVNDGTVSPEEVLRVAVAAGDEEQHPRGSGDGAGAEDSSTQAVAVGTSAVEVKGA
jgi:ABC-type sugar transport system ATPase subunit